MKFVLHIIVSLTIGIAPPASADVFGIVPNSEAEYKEIFGVSPTSGEVGAIADTWGKAGNGYTPTSTLSELRNHIANSGDLFILIGHNQKGSLMLPNGQKIEIQNLVTEVEKNNKLAIILTCNGKWYTSSPSPRLKTSFQDAIDLSREIERAFRNFDPGPNLTPSVASGPSFPMTLPASPSLSKSQCEAIFRTVSHARSNGVQSHAFRREVNRIIFRAEAAKIATNAAKLLVPLSTSGVLVYALGEE